MTPRRAKTWTVDLMAKAELPRPPEWGFAASPVVLGNLLIVEATFTCALDKTTGKEIWRSQAYNRPMARPLRSSSKTKPI